MSGSCGNGPSQRIIHCHLSTPLFTSFAASRCFFLWPAKILLQNAVGEWNLSNPRKRISIYDIPACFSRAFNKACTQRNITSGFRKSGIFPLNSDMFTDVDFLAATVFQQEPEKVQTNVPTTKPSASPQGRL